MSVENYECLLRNAPAGSYVLALLQEGLIVSADRKIFFIVWKESDLKLLRDLAAEKCPEALVDLTKAVKFGRLRRQERL